MISAFLNMFKVKNTANCLSRKKIFTINIQIWFTSNNCTLCIIRFFCVTCVPSFSVNVFLIAIIKNCGFSLLSSVNRGFTRHLHTFNFYALPGDGSVTEGVTKRLYHRTFTHNASVCSHSSKPWPLLREAGWR